MLSKRLTYQRKLHKKTQQEVADLIGLSRPAYTAYEIGNREPDYDTLKKISKIYNVSIDYLLGNSDEPNIEFKNEFEAFKNNPSLERWFKELPNSEEEDLEALKDMWEIIQRNKNK